MLSLVARQLVCKHDKLAAASHCWLCLLNRHVPRLKFIQDQKSGEQTELEATIEQLAQERRNVDIREA